MQGRRDNLSESNTDRQRRLPASGNGCATQGVAGATQPSNFAARDSLATTLVGLDAAYSAKRRRLEELARELISRLVVTPGRVIMYYSEKLGIDDGSGMLGERHRQQLANYAAAELGIADHEFWRLDVGQFGAMLRAEHERKRSQQTTPREIEIEIAERNQRPKKANKKPARRQRRRAPRESVTARELEAYSLRQNNLSYREIGEQLGISASAAGKLVRSARRIVDRRSRSVQTRAMPTDHRGQSTIGTDN
ncbi:MAG TPA: hypothetical protein P5081_19720 [Phycisphaerae bacterium]|nr:hypothetical protein [Phycisphaerae bacterium]